MGYLYLQNKKFMKQKLINKIEKKQENSINFLIVNVLLLVIGMGITAIFRNEMSITRDQFIYISLMLIGLVIVSLIATIRNHRLAMIIEKKLL